MTATLARLGESHKSDAGCLARFKAEVDNPRTWDSDASRLGTLCHAICENLTRASVTNSAPDPWPIVRETIHEAVAAGESSRFVVSQAVEIMATALGPKSRLKFYVPPGAKVAVEWRWALDDEFEPVAACGRCSGTGALGAAASPCDVCRGSGWSRPTAYAGMIDHLEIGAPTVVSDYKSILARTAQWEVRGAFEARMYAFAVLRHFPKLPTVQFRYVLLRHGYAISETFKRGDTWEESTKAALKASRAARLRAIESGSWPETLGEDCGWCPIKPNCGETKRMIALGGRRPADLGDEELARMTVAAGHLAGDFEKEARARVKKSDAPLPLGDGSVLGKKPAQAFEAVIDYDRAMDTLRGFGMTREQEIEWFRYVMRHTFPGALKKALYALCGSAAKGMIDSDEWIRPFTRETFSTWTPERVELEKKLTEDELDALLDEMLDGG